MSPSSPVAQPVQRRRILLVDDEAIIREPIAAALDNAGYQTLIAGSGAEALSLLKSTVPDLIILDIRMPKMDGIALLSAIRGPLALTTTPVILLTGVADRQRVMQASALGVREYVLKGRFALKDLLARIAKHWEAEPETGVAPRVGPSAPSTRDLPHAVSALMTRHQLIERIDHALRGRTLSGAVAQVISLAASPRASMSDLGSLIARDSMLSANVLRVANSAAYTSAKAVITNIPDAIRQIGCATVGRIAAAVAVIDAMPETSPDGFNPIRAWQHSFAVAQLCQRLSSQGEESGSTAYLVGLCHDLTEILFNAEFPIESEKIDEAQRHTDAPRSDIERQMLGMTHAELVPVVLARIGLPETIRSPIVDFHNAVSAGTACVDPLGRVLALAELYANGMLLASSTGAVVSPLTRVSCTKATGNADPSRPDTATVRAEVFCLSSMLARLSPRDDAGLATPLLDQRDVKVWLARDRALSSFDPLAAALESLATVHVSDRLPTPSEAQQFQALIVSTSTASGTPGMSDEDISAAVKTIGGTLPLLRLAAGVSPDPAQPSRPSISLAELERFVGSGAGPASQVAA